MNSNNNKTHCCIPREYLCSSRSNLTKYFYSKKHIEKIQNPVIVGTFKCPNCDKMYKSNPGLWAHKTNCVPIAAVVLVPPETDLHARLDNLEIILLEMERNQGIMYGISK
jgi:hypothetical protein